MRWFFGGSSDPRAWQLGFTGDVMYTEFLNDLYVRYRWSGIVAVTQAVQW
jgi:hypothetical protein